MFEFLHFQLYANNSEVRGTGATDFLQFSPKGKYIFAYKKFMKWQILRNTTNISEATLLEYFHELAYTYKPSSLWGVYNMLKSTIQDNDNIDIGTFRQISAFIKTKAPNYSYKPKARVFSEREVHKFIDEAPNMHWLHVKVSGQQCSSHIHIDGV